jgi:hypothetical protein
VGGQQWFVPYGRGIALDVRFVSATGPASGGTGTVLQGLSASLDRGAAALLLRETLVLNAAHDLTRDRRRDHHP